MLQRSSSMRTADIDVMIVIKIDLDFAILIDDIFHIRGHGAIMSCHGQD
jgi:hypothetical protein